MKPSPAPKRILFVALNKREAGSVPGNLRAARHSVSLVEDLEAAQALLASQGFDQAILPAPIVASFLEQRAVWPQANSEAWRRSTAGIAHDIRSLLNALSHNLEEMQRQSLSRDFEVNGLAEIRHRISVISAFLDELVFEMTSGDEELNLSVVDLEDAVEAAAIVVYPTASERQQRLVIDIDEEVAHVRADRTKLKMALTNLLDYATRHSPILGTVTVGASRDEDQCVIVVSHAGEGVTQSELRRLFSPASRGEGTTGLGLSQAKRIVEQHGGRVWVESQRGSGTSVFISLPAPLSTPKRGRRDRNHLGSLTGT